MYRILFLWTLDSRVHGINQSFLLLLLSIPEDVPIYPAAAWLVWHLWLSLPRKELKCTFHRARTQVSGSVVDYMEMEMEVSESAQTANSPAVTRPKRSRTGCLTCRTRRRKCDEERPACQNCMKKGFECRYAAAFQILGKNNFTPDVGSSVDYANVRFVGDHSKAAADGYKKPQNATPDDKGESTGVFNSSLTPISSSFEGSVTRTGHSRSTDLRNVTNHTPSPNSYEYAVHGLLALGSSNSASQEMSFPPVNDAREQSVSLLVNSVVDLQPALDLADEVGQDFDNVEEPDEWVSIGPVPVPTGVEELHMTVTGKKVNSSAYTNDYTAIKHIVPITASDSGSNPQHTSTSELSVPNRQSHQEMIPCDNDLNLLQYYRYQIAPWLDICDFNQYFGVEVLGLSADSARIRHGILALAAAASSRSHTTRTREATEYSTGAMPGRGLASDTLLDVFHILTDVLTDLPKYWQHEEHDGQGKQILETLLPHLTDGSSLATSAYWLLVRLVLSSALMATKLVRIPLPFVAENLFRSTGNDNIARCAQDAMALCVDAVMFSQGDEDQWLQQRYGLNRVEVWKMLIQGFAHWYIHRPQEFQPIIELYPRDGVRSDNDFPMVVFTGAAAILANQLYHTGMLLLLQSKPRFADKPNSNSSSMSSLWHAHRICGIATQNDGRVSWDPCLIASLIVAARTVTHGSQYAAIFDTLEAVQRLTGWNTSRYTDELKREWQLADGW
ncbi:hypothetical protein BKA66DRAFT_575204 [Pyrenochaeta sp. MPI-SDFR-AT-0127]|nr:hypothetical protein BKA66DRAFT_575204 [Pyrenochaeta sp. MPI-SDFR-AT-0127]